MHTATVAAVVAAAVVIAAPAGLSTIRCLDRQRLLAARVEQERRESVSNHILRYPEAIWRETPIAPKVGVIMGCSTYLSEDLLSPGYQLGEDGQQREPTRLNLRGRDA